MQTIQYLIPLSPKVAQTVIQQLSQMLRYSLRTASHTVKLAEELSYKDNNSYQTYEAQITYSGS